MKIYWPTRSDGLPPSQRLMPGMPRFTDKPFRPPPLPSPVHVAISIDREPIAELTAADLQAFEPVELTADFHCVTTWSVRNLVWTGVPFRSVAAAHGVEPSTAPYVVARAADGRRGHFCSSDAFASDVILATHLNHEPLDARHGAPLRLVAPQHYAYKSIKHLTGLDFRNEAPSRLGKEHLRGRVAREERHPSLPNWLVRTPYRLLITPTAHVAERSLRRSTRHGNHTTSRSND